jgi:putative flippase GtrA
VLRFALVGSTCGLIQLGLLHILVEAEVQANLANLAAFAISAQVNFILSQFFTWRDRWAPSLRPSRLISRLFLFNGSVATTGVVNQSVFALANLIIWYLPAAALGIAVAAVTNFLLNDRIVFRLANSQRIAVNPHG